MSRTDLTNYSDCSIWNALEIVRPKWAIHVILELMVAPEGSLAFSDFERLIPDINPRMLSKRLKSLEQHNIIEKYIEDPTKPKKTRYKLTKAGKSFVNVILALRTWSVENVSKNDECKNDLCRHILFIKQNFKDMIQLA